MAGTTIAGRHYELTAELVAGALEDRLPDPVRDHFVVVAGQRWPPKQVIAAATGIDRADFTTHHASRTLRRLGFVVGRREDGPPPTAGDEGRHDWPHQGRQAAALEPHAGRWVLQRGVEVLVVADTAEEVFAWAEEHDVDGGVALRVPSDDRGLEGATRWSAEL